MLKIFTSEDRLMVWHIHQRLVDMGIPCSLRNEYAVGGAGELAPQDCWPEIWLADEEWLPKAKSAIDSLKHSADKQFDWFCRQCQEKNYAGFDICWHCEAERPDPEIA